ncbi:MAG: type II toxin-antitoxin system HicB family antitoxin [Nostoc sp.]|uniref:type II toxin-antitoxin system HicB family antitoxin n=1 Tax=Nostoc sp. TaxID=1180 RepID=UPI002FFB83AF
MLTAGYAYALPAKRDPDTKFYIGYVLGFPGAHSQGETLDELQENLREVIEMLLEELSLQTRNAIAQLQGTTFTNPN